MKRKINWLSFIPSVLMVIAAVLAAVSSSTAYAMAELPLVLCCCALCAVLDTVSILLLKKPGILRDLILLITTASCAAVLCLTLTGRANLMGYVWFSDLEKDNALAVTALNLACGTMGLALLAAVTKIVKAYRKN